MRGTEAVLGIALLSGCEAVPDFTEVGCGGDVDAVVTIDAGGFDPADASIPYAGDVRWNNEDDVAHMPCLLLAADLVSVRLHSTEHYRGRIDRDPAEWIRQRELIVALDQRGSDAFPATVLGL